MLRHRGLAHARRIRPRGMKKSAASAPHAIHSFFIKQEEVVGVVAVLLADHIDQARPAVANANDLIAFAKRPESDGANGRIEAGNVAAPGEDADDSLFGLHVRHESLKRPFLRCGTENYPLCREI